MSQRPSFTLLTRPGCGLCEEFELEMRTHLGDRPYALEHVEVDSRPEWRIRYGRSIPVLLDAAGSLVCETHFDAAAVDRHS